MEKVPDCQTVKHVKAVVVACNNQTTTVLVVIVLRLLGQIGQEKITIFMFVPRIIAQAIPLGIKFRGQAARSGSQAPPFIAPTFGIIRGHTYNNSVTMAKSFGKTMVNRCEVTYVREGLQGMNLPFVLMKV